MDEWNKFTQEEKKRTMGVIKDKIKQIENKKLDKIRGQLK